MADYYILLIKIISNIHLVSAYLTGNSSRLISLSKLKSMVNKSFKAIMSATLHCYNEMISRYFASIYLVPQV